MQLSKDTLKASWPIALVAVLGLMGIILFRQPGAMIVVEILLLLAVAGLGVYFFMRQSTLSARIDALRQGLLRFKAGDFSTRVEDDKFDEFGEIVRLTNEMAVNLQKLQGSMTQVERQRQQQVVDLTQTIAKPLAGLRGALDGALRDTDGPVAERELMFNR